MWNHRSSLTTKKLLFESPLKENSQQEEQLLKLFKSLEHKFDSYSEYRINEIIELCKKINQNF